MSDEKRLSQARRYWDEQASAFDDEPDHGLRDPAVRAAWSGFLAAFLPSSATKVLDIGCGTGSLSVLLAALGHDVTGIDLSPSMISLARTKAAALGYPVQFQVMDAASPRLPDKGMNAIVCRHLLWTLPEPGQVLERWYRLLKPDGRLILIEGYWGTGAGLRANEILKILPASLRISSLRDLGADPQYWGREISDERYAIIADKHP